MKKLICRKELEMGEIIPRFYLPVRRITYSAQYECWWWFLAPFILFGYIIQNVFRSIWTDLMWWLHDLKFFNQIKEKLIKKE